MDRADYHDKMKSMLKDRDTYEIVKPPFRTVERELNMQLPQLKNEQKLNYHTRNYELLTAHHTLLEVRFN
jgi:hypothetical protein